jgi:2-hydroxy-3-oxopropionate reductase
MSSSPWFRTRPTSNARQIGLSLPNTAATQQLFNACAARGGAKWDHSALIRALERMANHEIDQSD